MMRAFTVLVITSIIAFSQAEESYRRQKRFLGDDKPVTLDSAVLKRGVEEIAIAESANKQAKQSAKDATASRMNILAVQASDQAEAGYAKVEPLLPEARAQFLTVRKYEALAAMHAKHAREVLFGSRHIAEDAAQKAKEATKGWIMQDAEKSAEASASVDNRADRLAGAVAAAAEPYHLALLRNQKFCEETYAKAKSAQSSAVKLITDAKKIAVKAQEMQSLGTMGLETRQTYSQAAGMMNTAELMRQWGDKFYAQANKACGSSGGYEMLEQQAAANTAATMIMNAPMKLPPKR